MPNRRHQIKQVFAGSLSRLVPQRFRKRGDLSLSISGPDVTVEARSEQAIDFAQALSTEDVTEHGRSSNKPLDSDVVAPPKPLVQERDDMTPVLADINDQSPPVASERQISDTASDIKLSHLDPGKISAVMAVNSHPSSSPGALGNPPDAHLNGSTNLAAAVSELHTAEVNHRRANPSRDHESHFTELVAESEADNFTSFTEDAKPLASLIDEKLHDFAYGIPVFVNALDEIGKLHPFVGVVVIAFKAVYKLESARHSNDKKILLLFVEMKDMLSVLLRLKDLNEIGKETEDRLSTLSNETASDIRACANACDAYSRKKLVVKFLSATVWESRLAEFVEIFSNRRREFEFALSVRTALTADVINRKMNEMLDLFKGLLSPEQSVLQKLVEHCISSGPVNEGLRKLLRERPLLVQTEVFNEIEADTKMSNTSMDGIEEAMNEIKELGNSTISDERGNMTRFDRKFELQKKQLVEQMRTIVDRAADRTIEQLTEVSKGPERRIVDMDIHAVWVEGGWKGNVKARHFVLALRDYYKERAERLKQGDVAATPIPDEWALRYIDVPYLQSIVETIDDDASGFITISEINKFTAARPLDWSLPRWVAFWAFGWKKLLNFEADMIHELFDKMFMLLPNLKQENRPFAEEYLDVIWRRVLPLTLPIYAPNAPRLSGSAFLPYAFSEARRLRRNLFGVRYNIDELDVLSVVTGPGRIEKYFFLVVRLILRRHHHIFLCSQKRIINPREFSDAAATISWILAKMRYRYLDLRTSFSNRRLDLDEQFETFAFGSFRYLHKPEKLWTEDIMKMNLMKGTSTNLVTTDVLDVVLDYPRYDEHKHCAAFSEGDLEQPSRRANPIVGTWSRLLYETSDSEFPFSTMVELRAEGIPVSERNGGFELSGVLPNGRTFTAAGTCTATTDDNIYEVKFESSRNVFYSGQLDVRSEIVSGICTKKDSPLSLCFLMKRTPSHILRFLPSPAILSKCKYRALWTFAISATLDQVRRRSWSWSFFRERRDTRRKYIELRLRQAYGIGPALSSDEVRELQRTAQLLNYRDACFYSVIISAEATVGTQILALDNYREPPLEYPGAKDGHDIAVSNGYTGDFWKESDLIDTTERNPVLGVWYCLQYGSGAEFVLGPMLAINITSDSSDGNGNTLKATIPDTVGSIYTLSGNCKKTNKEGIYFVRFRTSRNRGQTTYYYGQLNVATCTIAGRYGRSPNPSQNKERFLMKRTNPQILCFLPSPAELSRNKPRALWTYAVSAILYDVRRRLWSWSFFRERRELREQFINLMMRFRRRLGPPLSLEEAKVAGRTMQRLTFQDASFYERLIERRIKTLPSEIGYWCDVCNGGVVDDRITCVDCVAKANVLRSVDFCTKLDCLEGTVNRSDLSVPHDQRHTIIMMCRVRQCSLVRRLPEIQAQANLIIQTVQETFETRSAAETNKEIVNEESLIALRHLLGTDLIESYVLSEFVDAHTSFHGEAVGNINSKPSGGADGPDPAIQPQETSGFADADNDEGEGVEIDGAKRDIKVVCVSCFQPVHLPCWVCLTCSGEVSICEDCALTDPKRKHELYHILVRCPKRAEADKQRSPEEDHKVVDHARLARLEESITAVNDRLSQMAESAAETHELLLQRIQAMGERHSRLENMVESLVTYMKSQPSAR